MYTSESDEEIFFENRKISDIIKNKQQKNSLKKRIIYLNPVNVDIISSDEDFVGGDKVKIPKTFINKLKKNPNFKTSFKNYNLEEIKPNSKEVIMATIVDYNFLKRETGKESLKNNDILDYFTNGDYLPLIYGDTNHKNIIYMKKIVEKKKKVFMRKKKNIFNVNDRPIVVFFKINSNVKFYKTVKKETEDANITKIDDKAVNVYLIGRYFFLIPNPSKNIKISSIEGIYYEKDDFVLKPFKNDEYPFEKMMIEDFENILGNIVNKCTKFEQ